MQLFLSFTLAVAEVADPEILRAVCIVTSRKVKDCKCCSDPPFFVCLFVCFFGQKIVS